MSNEVKVSKFTVISKVEGDTIIVDTFGDGVFIRNDFYGTVTFTREKAEQNALFNAENFGIYKNGDTVARNDISGPLYKLTKDTPEPTPPTSEPTPTGTGNSAMLNDDAQTKITGIVKDKAEIEMSTYFTTTVSPQARAVKNGKTYLAGGKTFRNGDTEKIQKEIWNSLYTDIAEQIYQADIKREDSSTETTITALPAQNTGQSPTGGETITAQGEAKSPSLSFARELALKNAYIELSKIAKGRKVTNQQEVSALEEILYNTDNTYSVKRTINGIATGEAKPGIEERFPNGYEVVNITFEYTQVDPDRPKPETPPATTPQEPAPPKDAVKEEQVKYQPKTRVSEPKSTGGGEYVEKESGKDYKGPYIQAYKNKYYAGSNLEQNGVELIQAGTRNLDPSTIVTPALSLLFQSIKGFFNKKASKADRERGRTMRYFMQRKKDNKIVELDKNTYQEAQKAFPSQNFAQVDWLIKGPADDQTINGYPFEGAASKNKKAIQALEPKLPGISKFITDYAFLVEDPASKKDKVLQSQTTLIPDPEKELENSRKANFDFRK